jgi:Rieske 2Fe-2S family protein
MDRRSKYLTAPIDPDRLAGALRPLGTSTMLPREAYVDTTVFDWEQEHFFGGGWMCVGQSQQVARPGEQRAEPAGKNSVLLVRSHDGTLRAFANACRHRGHELLSSGSVAQRNSIVCPYHSWTYSLAGQLRVATGFEGCSDFRTEDWGLMELPVAEWHGLIFVDTSGQANPLVDSLRDLDRLIAPWEPERLVIAGRHTHEVAANWKVLTENYHECYHCPIVHPELCRVSPSASGGCYRPEGAWAGGWMNLRDGMTTMSMDGGSRGVPLRGLDATGLRTVLYVSIFPNVLLHCQPDYVETDRLVPIAADRTMVECTWAFAPEVSSGGSFNPGYAIEFWKLINGQDRAICESVQRGLSAPSTAPGPLSPEEDESVYHFVTMIARAYLGQQIWTSLT